MSPKTRILGSSEIAVTRLVLGCMSYRDDRDERRFAVFNAALDTGINAFDTAPLYGFGDGEAQLGRFLRTRRERPYVFTKCGLRWDGDGLRLPPRGEILFRTPDGRRVLRDSRPESIRQEVEQSLTRLGLETLDLLQVHQRDRHTPIRETIESLRDLKCRGSIREFGVSNYDATELAQSVSVSKQKELCSVQSRFSLLHHELETSLLPLCREHGIGFLAYSPLAQGLLAAAASTPRDFRANGEDFQSRQRAHIDRAIAHSLLPIARANQTTAAAVALAWATRQSGITAAIVGASTEEQLRGIAPALELELDSETVFALRAAFSERPSVRPSFHRAIKTLRKLGFR